MIIDFEDGIGCLSFLDYPFLRKLTLKKKLCAAIRVEDGAVIGQLVFKVAIAEN